MKNKILIIIIVILSVVAIISSPKKETAFSNEVDNTELELTIKDQEKNSEQVINLEDYIVGVVAGEMPASFNEEALKAQAIASRTYALYKMNTKTTTYDLVTDVSNQVYITEEDMLKKWGNDYNKYYTKIKNAVNSTKDLVMKYNGEVISSYYFSMSNGKTEDVALVFGESRDYLKSVDSSWDKEIKSFEKTITMSKEDFCQKLNITCNTITIKNISKSSSDRVESIVINNKSFKGTDIRKLLGLRSTDFEIIVNNKIEITTKGYGHGVGMSQYGANEMAKEGATYDEILNHYYQNINISKI